MLDFMTDLETYGTDPGSAIASIGACVVGEPDRTFYVTVDLQSCLDVELTISGGTIDFWLRQSDAARAALLVDRRLLPHALEALDEWMDVLPGAKDVCVWGNGASFDPVLLEAAFRACKMAVPWKFYQVRCYRTMKGLLPAIRMTPPVIPHHALYDALAQAEHLRVIQDALAPVTQR